MFSKDRFFIRIFFKKIVVVNLKTILMFSGKLFKVKKIWKYDPTNSDLIRYFNLKLLDHF
ncbi:hypothetical protein LEP1GSC059_0895 [Leptospira noguchii serovar Panama str. CZ214]|uniref:Uncharacterized protein n=1 Tax=Leptospira noguchii serovar Panama str. CZ214 TaxID=1001595 RepID=T0GS04_9LEPT|nr:hypothetical protein LEP1GSC059_0895 [Leptospira noguchii serovar Panama str. CZ214]